MTRSSSFKPLRSYGAAALVLTGAMMAAACSDNTPPVPAATEVAAVKPPDTNARVQTYKDCWRAFNTQAWDQFGQCYADNAVSEDVDSTPPVATGRAAIVEPPPELLTRILFELPIAKQAHPSSAVRLSTHRCGSWTIRVS